ncbi:MAG: hypothetical protein O3A96_12120 [Proteobacteria bacterium]|nr:hypothetical protein [Pseudomonadota bacterium]
MAENTAFETIQDDDLGDEALDKMGGGKICHHVSALSFWPNKCDIDV